MAAPLFNFGKFLPGAGGGASPYASFMSPEMQRQMRGAQMGAIGASLLAGGAPRVGTPPNVGAALSQGFQNATNIGQQSVGNALMLQNYKAQQAARERTTSQIAAWRKANPQYAHIPDASIPAVITAQLRPDDIPTGMRQNAAGDWVYDDAYLKGQKSLRAAGRNEFNIQTTQESAYAGTSGTNWANTAERIYAGARTARARNLNMRTIDKLLEDVATGTAAESRTKITRVAELLGIDLNLIGDLGSAEAANSLLSIAALQMRDPSGGAGMTGSMSERDLEFLEAIPAGLGQTPVGRRLNSAIQQKINQRKIDIAQMAAEWETGGKQIGPEFEQAVQKKYGAQDLFSDSEWTQMEVAIRAEKLGTTPVDIGRFAKPDGSAWDEPALTAEWNNVIKAQVDARDAGLLDEAASKALDALLLQFNNAIMKAAGAVN